MPTINQITKKRITIFPVFEFESLISSFLDHKRFEFTPMEIVAQNGDQEYAQTMQGNWCAQTKNILAMYEKTIGEEKIDIVIGLLANLCQYPLVCGDINQWIKKDFKYYPIFVGNNISARQTLSYVFNTLKALMPEYTYARFTIDIPQAIKKMVLAQTMERTYFKNLPLVPDPWMLKKRFKEFRQKFIETQNINQAKKIFSEFKNTAKDMRIRKKPQARVLFSGDFFILVMNQFPLFDIDLFFAKHKIELVQPYSLSYFFHFSKKYFEHNKKATELFSETISSQYTKINPQQSHPIEVVTIAQILKGLDEKVDGIIFLYPAMCMPSVNISNFLKKEEGFGLPFVEITHDEHTNEGGVITRLEAFLNIMLEQVKQK